MKLRKKRVALVAGVFTMFLVAGILLLKPNTPHSHQEKIEEQEEVITIPFSDKSLQTLKMALDTHLSKNGVNGALSVLYKSTPIYQRYQGLYDLLNKEASITASTMFQLASVSKPFTSMAVLMLYEQGKINIEDKVKQYIPEFPYEAITIRHLLNHTSGLQNYMELVEKNWTMDKPITNEDVLKLLVENHLPLNFIPGTRHSYSNTGFVMLALLVERVTKVPFYQWMHDHIFVPAGMKTAWVWNQQAADTMQECAKGYLSRSRKARIYPHDKCDEIVGDKSIFCSMNDMICWDRAIRKRMFVSDSLMQLAWTPSLIIRKTVNYGLGWRMKTFGDRQAVYHNGKWNGFTASHTRFNDEEITILVLSNTRDKAAQIVNKVQEQVFNILYSDTDVATPANDEEDLDDGGSK